MPDENRRLHDQAQVVEIRAQLARLLEASELRQSPRLQRLLRHIVEATLAGDGERLKGYTLGVEVYDRGVEFDPNVDPIVRIEAGRLRSKLLAYYSTEGVGDAVRIDLPKGAYKARFVFLPTPLPADARSTPNVPAAKPTANVLLAVTGVDVAQPVDGFSGRPAIAVLPFANLSGDSAEEYFGDGLAEDILTRLAMWRWLPVIARNSSFAYRGQATDVKAVGRALGARYVFEGSVRKIGNRVRVNGQLIDATNGYHLWAERYDRVLEDLFAIQDELTDGIVGALEAVIGRAETERAKVKAPDNLDAWDCLLRGTWHLHRMRREDFAAAEPLFLRAAQLDPSSAASQSGLARLRLCEVVFLWTANRTDTLVEAMTRARAALAIDPLDAWAHSTLGYLLALTGKHDEALTFCRKGIELNPSYASGYVALTITHAFRGEPEAGIRAAETALRISPHDMMLPNFLASLSFVHYLARNYEKAAEVASLAVQRGPHYAGGWRTLANALGQLGRLPEARSALERCLALMPSFTSEQEARATMGFRDEAVFQHWLEGLRKAGWKG